MKQNIKLTAGELVVFSDGAYSDYGYRGSYVALQDVSEEDMYALAGEVRKEAAAREEPAWRINQIDMFEAAMIRKGWLAIVNIREIHLGTYETLDLGDD